MLSFQNLVSYRRRLQDFCSAHIPSIKHFYDEGLSFRLHPLSLEPAIVGDQIRHLSSTATCWASVLDCPDGFRTLDLPRNADALAFCEAAIKLPADASYKDDVWKSDGSARIYCRCRSLPFVVEHLSNYSDNIEKHLRTIFLQLDKEPEIEKGKPTGLKDRKSPRFGIGEAGPTIEDLWYPPNAFHTFWTLRLLEVLQVRFDSDYQKLLPKLDLETRRKQMLLFARHTLGHQIALHSASPQSSMLDTDQLAWSLATVIAFGSDFESNLANQDFLKQALICLFSTQTDVGTWRHYAPLFHYRQVGNAYCYIFETFATLLRAALAQRPDSEFFRTVLFPHAEQLLKLWLYATSTHIRTGDKTFGWSSGHRLQETKPESWATASVFAYSQALRRLIGLWTREQAQLSLNHPRTHTPQQSEDEIVDRGETWRKSGERPASDKLMTMFVNPIRMHRLPETAEPDLLPIRSNQARAAILFGPPGTSKSALAKAVAGAVSWEYIELHASHFVSEGLPNVHKRADEIFQTLMELDHAVVLFDEIDELVRSRESEHSMTEHSAKHDAQTQESEVGTDTFGRFLTTSMLPKLAELWKARKIVYFVATNHIRYFDPAITRSGRFDALIYVGPPTLQKKISILESKITEILQLETQAKITVPLRRVFTALLDAKAAQKYSEKYTLASLAVLRFDELPALAYRLAEPFTATTAAKVVTIGESDFIRALQKLGDPRLRKVQTYVDFIAGTDYQTRDYNALNTWSVIDLAADPPPPPIQEVNDGYWVESPFESLDRVRVSGGYCLRSTNRPGVATCIATPAPTSSPGAPSARSSNKRRKRRR